MNEFFIQLCYNRSARDYHDISFTNSTYFIHLICNPNSDFFSRARLEPVLRSCFQKLGYIYIYIYIYPNCAYFVDVELCWRFYNKMIFLEGGKKKYSIYKGFPLNCKNELCCRFHTLNDFSRGGYQIFHQQNMQN